MTGRLRIFCPEMFILATARPWIRECQELPSTYVIYWENGDVTEGNITFPKVKVRLQKIGYWLVDAVPAKGHNIAVTMDKEDVWRDNWKVMLAQPCLAYGHYVDPQGKSWGIVPKTESDGTKTFFPLCRATAVGWGLFKYLAEPVVAEGLVVG